MDQNTQVITPEYKEEVARQVVEAMLQAVENNTVHDYEMPTISRVFLERLDNCTTQEDIFTLLQKLSNEWVFFKPLLTLEKGKAAEQLEKEGVEKILELTREGRIDEALDVARANHSN